MNKNHRHLLDWQVTPWIMNRNCGWKQQPVILVEGQVPFFANHPEDYIEKLQAIHDDPMIARGPFFACIGQFKDALEQVWDNKELVLWHEKQSWK